MTSSQTVLLIAKAYPPTVGGVESYSELIARAYVRQGVTPTVITSWDGPRGWHDLSYPEGSIHVYNVGMHRQPIVFARMIAAIGRVRFGQNFHFIHATTWRPALALLPWLWPQTKVLTIHGQEVLNYPFILKRGMIKVLLDFDLVHTVSHSTMQVAKNALEGANPQGVWEVNFNGLSFPSEAAAFDRPARSSDSVLRILSFARLARRKNIDGCLRALARMRTEGIDNFSYTIAGTGPLHDEIAQLIVTLGLQDYVTMKGYVEESEIPDLYRNADIFIHPQTASENKRDLEGFGLAIADSISFGCAAIVGETGGPADFVKHSERGLVVDGYDDGAISEALRQLLTDPSTRNELASNGRSWCLENLSWDRHVQKVIASVKALNT
ncbi:glycosyltransferase family 4 protein [Pseudophaeobacter sp.]|uniref:glycosyltransferase family 4 protein n=1 Tax=Pseudophaeobacter sp. TaxID=1971739 RepID=UPI003299BDAD